MRGRDERGGGLLEAPSVRGVKRDKARLGETRRDENRPPQGAVHPLPGRTKEARGDKPMREVSDTARELRKRWRLAPAGVPPAIAAAPRTAAAASGASRSISNRGLTVVIHHYAEDHSLDFRRGVHPGHLGIRVFEPENAENFIDKGPADGIHSGKVQ